MLFNYDYYIDFAIDYHNINIWNDENNIHCVPICYAIISDDSINIDQF